MRRQPVWRTMSAAMPLVALASWACGVSDAAGTRGATTELSALASAAPAAAAGPEPDSANYVGDGFAIRYPADATVGTLGSDAAPGALAAIEIRGPALRDSEGEPIVGSASYVLEVAAYADSGAAGLEDWVARYGDREHDDAAEAEGREEEVGAAAPATVAGLPAFRQALFGGDCELVRYYVARGGRVVVFRYADFPIANDSLNPQNLRTYAAVMGSFHWTKR